MIEVELPDGSIAEFPRGTDPATIKQAVAKRFPPSAKAQAETAVREGPPPDYRLESPLGAGFQRFTDLVTDPFGLQDEMVGAGQYARKLVTSGGDFDAASQAYSDAAERVRAERRVARQDYGIAPEIIGGLATAGPAKAIQGGVGLMQGIKQGATAGAAFGGLAGAGQAEGGVGERLVGGAQGAAIGAGAGGALSAAIPLATRGVRGVGEAVRYGNQAVRRARNPEQAAVESVADRLVKEGIDPAQLRAQIAPRPSPQLARRGFTEEQVADMIARRNAGETAQTIADDLGVAPDTVRRYFNTYEAANPTPRNIVDIARDMSGDGTASPVTRLGRAAASLADDGETTQRLLTRQQTQSGRVNSIIDQAGGARNFDDEIARLQDLVTNKARQAYATAAQQAQPFNLRPAIRKYRQAAFARSGELRGQMEKAVDLFFEPAMVQRGDKVGLSKLGQPITDVRRFQAARQDLDQMIARSMQDGRPTPLTRQLTRLRQDVTKAVRKANPALAEADDLFSGARTAERLLDEGAKLSTRLGAPSREALRDFQKLSPEQQELFRLGFLRKLQDMASNTRDGGAVANQFQSPAVRKTVETLFPKSDKRIYKRGQDLIKQLRQEATTTRTKNDILAGSRTAELSSDMGRMMEGARAAADIATGRIGNVLNNLATRLSNQIGEEGAKQILRILTETEPAKLLPMLNRLAQAADTTAKRRALQMAIDELVSSFPQQFGAMGGISSQAATNSQQ